MMKYIQSLKYKNEKNRVNLFQRHEKSFKRPKKSKILPVKDDIQKRYTFKPVSRKVEIIPEKK